MDQTYVRATPQRAMPQNEEQRLKVKYDLNYNYKTITGKSAPIIEGYESDTLMRFEQSRSSHLMGRLN